MLQLPTFVRDLAEDLQFLGWLFTSRAGRWCLVALLACVAGVFVWAYAG